MPWIIGSQHIMEALYLQARHRGWLLTRISFPDNQGSAGGFKAGIRVAANLEDCNYFWLLVTAAHDGEHGKLGRLEHAD